MKSLVNLAKTKFGKSGIRLICRIFQILTEKKIFQLSICRFVDHSSWRKRNMAYYQNFNIYVDGQEIYQTFIEKVINNTIIVSN